MNKNEMKSLRQNNDLKLFLGQNKNGPGDNISINDESTFCFTYAANPSSAFIFGKASLRVLAKPGWVWIRTLTASMGQRAMSAKNSADALAARYNVVLHKYAFSYINNCFIVLKIIDNVYNQTYSLVVTNFFFCCIPLFAHFEIVPFNANK